MCRLLWKQKVPLKVQIFGWLLLRHKPMTKVFQKKMFPKPLIKCVVCKSREEDCSQCPSAQEIWTKSNTSEVDVTSEEIFQGSLRSRVFRREAEWRRILVVLWAAWQHHKEIAFQGRLVFAGGEENDVKGFVSSWCKGTCGVGREPVQTNV